MPDSPHITALLAAVRDVGPDFYRVQMRTWTAHRISYEATQRAAKQAEAAGLVKMTKPNRARASTWEIELVRRRPSREDADTAVRAFLVGELETDEPPIPYLIEDGADGWAFAICDGDTTSYVHHDLSIEWYGTQWPDEEARDGDE